ncbi:MAG: GNAT family N-acetyltransferase [Rhizobiaceae bacterium]|nr:GNAT family N-acetyltransferase [Rhizobiaceae bacterium]
MTRTSKRTSHEPIPVTVTHLEMTAPPAHYPPLPLGQNIALLSARSMPRHYYRYLIDRVGRHWHWVNMLMLSDAELDARLAEPGRVITTLYLDGAPAGFYEIAPTPTGSSELLYFGLMPHATGRGLGRWFLGAAISAAWASGNPSSVIVQTCTLDHPAALPLYQKLGFSPVGQSHVMVQPLSPAQRRSIIMR